MFPFGTLVALLQPWSVKSVREWLQQMSMVEHRDVALRTPLRESIDNAFSGFDARSVGVVESREGFHTHSRMTLQQIGDREGVTRERIRQVEAQFWEHFSDLRVSEYNSAPVSRRTLARITKLKPFVTACLEEFMNREGSLVVLGDSAESRRFRFLLRCVGVAQTQLPDGNGVVIGRRNVKFDGVLRGLDFDPEEDGSKLIGEIGKRLGRLRFKYLPAKDTRSLVESLVRAPSKKSTKADKVYRALQRIGRPAHYSEVCQMYNSMFADDQMPDRNVHAALDRSKKSIVWVGVRGTYALKKWGYERPSKGLHETVAQIIKERYNESGEPVPLVLITSEMGKHRKVVKPKSLLIAARFNPEVLPVSNQSFIPREAAVDHNIGPAPEDLDTVLPEFEGTLRPDDN